MSSVYFHLKSWKKNVTVPDGWVVKDFPHLCGNRCFALLPYCHGTFAFISCVLSPLSSHGWTSAAVAVRSCRVYITSASAIKDCHEDRVRMAKTEKCVGQLELHQQPVQRL